MPKYKLVLPSGSERFIGYFPDIESVHKLTIFKVNPKWKALVQKVSTEHKPSNRWALIAKEGRIVFLYGTYANALEITSTCNTDGYKVVKYPKDHFHPYADKEFAEQLHKKS